MSRVATSGVFCRSSLFAPWSPFSVFARGLHALAKIGEDVWIGTRDGLDLRTINSARSAFASFFFAREFFSAFDGGVGEGVYKVAMKVTKCP